MSDYVASKCIRLKIDHNSLTEILELLNKEEIAREKPITSIYEINEKLEKEGIRIVIYEEQHYIDIVLQHEYGESEVSMYMSLKEINEMVDDFKEKYPEILIDDIIVLAHSWYNGSEEPYTT